MRSIARRGIQFLRIGVVGTSDSNPRDDAALVGHSQALVDAGFFDPRHLGLLDFDRSGIADTPDYAGSTQVSAFDGHGSLSSSASLPL